MTDTREQMIDRLVEAKYYGMDYKVLYRFVEYYLRQEFEAYEDQHILDEYKEYFND